MKRNAMPWWKLAPALLLAGMTWSGVAAADDKDTPGKFDGPGGMSAPADPDRPEKKPAERWRRGAAGEKRMGGAGRRGGQGRHGRMGAGMRGRHPDAMARLDLSDRQKERIQAIRQAQQRRMIPLRADLEAAALDLRELLEAENPSRPRIDAAVDRLADVRAEAHKARIASRLEVRSVLTDAQRKTLKDLGGERGRGMHGGRRGGARGMGGGAKAG